MEKDKRGINLAEKNLNQCDVTQSVNGKLNTERIFSSHLQNNRTGSTTQYFIFLNYVAKSLQKL